MKPRPRQDVSEKINNGVSSGYVAVTQSLREQPSKGSHRTVKTQLDVGIVGELWKTPLRLPQECSFAKVLRLFEQRPVVIGKELHGDSRKDSFMPFMQNQRHDYRLAN